MSLESQIGALINRVGDTLALPQQVADVARDKVTQITATYLEILSRADITRFVAQNYGNDTTGAGTEALPYKTLDRALRDTPPNGLCTVILLADYTLTAHVRIYNKRLRIMTPGRTATATLSFGRYVNDGGRCTYRFVLEGDAAVSVLFCRVTLPNTDGYSNLVRDFRSAIVGPPDGVSDSIFLRQSASFLTCEIIIPDNPMGAMVSGLLVQVYVANCVFPGKPMLGWLVEKYQNPAGTAAKDCPDVFTNLSLI